MPKFNCPNCSQRIDAPDDLAGAESTCPNCDAPITVPSEMVSSYEPPVSDNKEYKIHTFRTGCFSGTLDPKKLQNVLNDYGRSGWRFARSIHEQQKVFFIFSREAHFLIFER